jgi:hypothetical protein
MNYTGIDYIYFRYKKIVSFESWVPYFSQFADLMRAYGSPYDGEMGLIDGAFTSAFRPGGLRRGEPEHQTGQREFYNGDNAYHGYQTMAALFPKGMLATRFKLFRHSCQQFHDHRFLIRRNKGVGKHCCVLIQVSNLGHPLFLLIAV